MSDDKYREWTIGFLILAAFLTWIGDKRGLTVQIVFALVAILVVAFMFPLAGLVLSIPVLVLAWFRNYQSFFDWFSALSGIKLNKEVKQ